MVEMIGNPDGPDHMREMKQGQGNRVSACIRIPDLDREDMHLCAGRSIGAGTPWVWFRLDVMMMRPGVIHVSAYKVVREAKGNEPAQLEKSFESGHFTLAQCYLNAELFARISQRA